MFNGSNPLYFVYDSTWVRIQKYIAGVGSKTLLEAASLTFFAVDGNSSYMFHGSNHLYFVYDRTWVRIQNSLHGVGSQNNS